ncbi:MAG: NAD(P)-dependent oxidoreductase [Candidatus Omnitrophica bacterium]|nr:NAD(P)-dependent oxidoreductase [Candidatus Omnitrophota bacterium]
MKILVTGSKGVIGQKLVEELENRGHEIMGIDLLHSQGERGFIQRMANEPWEYTRCDIGEYRQLERVFKLAGPFDLVYNCAADVGRWNGEDYYEQMWKSNLIGLKNIIRLQEEIGFKLVHFSSSEIYGNYKEAMKEEVTDKAVIKQMNEYAISKWANEMQIKNSIELFDTETVVIRLFNTYGEGEYYHPYRSVNCRFCYHALKKLPIIVYRGHHRASAYIDDCVTTIANISKNFIGGRVYNIGSDQYHSIEDLADIIWSYTKAPRKLIKYEEPEKLTTRVKKIDISRAKKELNHKITINLEEGVKNTIDWMRRYYNLP